MAVIGVGGGLEGLGAGGEGDVREAEVGAAMVVYGKEPMWWESCQLISCIANSGKLLRTGIVGVVSRCGGVGCECGSVFASDVGVRPDVFSMLDRIEYSRFAVSEPKL